MDNTSAVTSITDYSLLLKAYGVTYRPVGPYWLVGEAGKVQGWVIHLSAIESQVYELLNLVVPELIKKGLVFKIVLEKSVASHMLNGGLGYEQLGKLVGIYPEDELTANALAKFLIPFTNGFLGPAIPTDRRLGGIVYTRYVRAPYSIPFFLPKGVEWPFGDIVSHKIPPAPRLLNGTYYPFHVIKPDAKGDVIQGFYFKKLWQIRPCVIKQGRLNMITDAAGRDIQDRLKWQYDLYQDLSRDIPLPEIFDYFSVNDDTYLAMEFVKGIVLSTWINSVNADNCWLYLPTQNRLALIKMLLRIIDVIHRMHEKGYIHRDITPDNFLIDAHGSIFLIDMELTWCLNKRYPDPPFTWGTPGHMSPEQMAIQTPSTKEDIYGLGGMMIMFFTNLRPLKFHQHSVEELRNTVLFYTGDIVLADLISSCWEICPQNRPELKYIREILMGCMEKLQAPAVASPSIALNNSLIKDTIEAGFAGLALPIFLNQKGRWVSLIQKQEQHIGNEQVEMTLSEGWYTGMTGPLWLAARAKRAGVPVDMCLRPYESSWDYIWKNYLPASGKDPSLYAGAAGVAYALIEGLNSGLLSLTPEVIEQLDACFTQTSASFTLATGVAGQGIVLLQANNWMSAEVKQTLLQSYAYTLKNAQGSDGSWIIENSSGRKGDVSLGMGQGIAGIIWFLLSYLQRHPDPALTHITTRALDWLIRQRQNKRVGYTWTISTKSKIINKWSFNQGVPGIAGVFIKAYEVLQQPRYAEIAHMALSNIPAHPAITDFTLNTGLAGLGEVYLDAIRVLKTSEWKQRCDWIASLLACSCTKSENSSCFWFPDIGITVTTDLFTGNSGILHFLLRYSYPEKIQHPLS